MMLELKPVNGLRKYGVEWDVYGLHKNNEWLHILASDPRNNYAYDRLVCWDFLKANVFADRLEGDFREDLFDDDGKRFIVFLLPHDERHEKREITIPVPTPPT